MRVAVTVEQSWHVVPGGIATSTVELLTALSSDRDDLDLVGVSARHRGPPPDAFTASGARATAAAFAAGAVRVLAMAAHAGGRASDGTRRRRARHGVRRPALEGAIGRHRARPHVPEYPEHYTWHSAGVLSGGLELARRHARLVDVPVARYDGRMSGRGDRAGALRLGPVGSGRPPVSTRPRGPSRYGLGRPYVLFCGTIEPRKNLLRLVECLPG